MSDYTQPNHPQDQPTADQESSRKSRSENVRSFLTTLAILLVAPLVAVVLTAFVFQSYQVDGPSMETTLNNNDRLIVWKMPRTWARITHHAYVPARGDVVIFNEPQLAAYGQGSDKQLIKRVIGLPGDRVVVKNGSVTIYNSQHPDGFQPDKTLAYGKVIPSTEGDIDLKLSGNQIFVCGDNRPVSLDSRSFGPVDLNQVVGKLAMRVLPLSKAERF